MADSIDSATNTDVEAVNDAEQGIPERIHLDVILDDPEVVAEVAHYPEGEIRDEFVNHAIRIGILALKHARGQIDADAVRREADHMMSRLSSELNQHQNSLNIRVGDVLKQYFDPESGHLHERIQRLVKRDGELADLLSRHIGEEDSMLCKTLGRHFGEESRLLKWLNPDKSQGFLAEMSGTLEGQLKVQREQVLNQFSLDNKEGALSRFIDELTTSHGKLTEGLEGKIDEVVKEFSLDQEESALSRLVKKVSDAEKKIRDEFSLDEENSALARLKREMLGVLTEQEKTNNTFREEVKSTLREMAVRKKEAARSTRHGMDFEEGLSELVVQEARRSHDFAEQKGNTTGSIRNCKVGDIVVELGPDNVAAGAKIAIEAKENASYTLSDARSEIETARKNRRAQIGLFVFSRRTAPADLEPLVRYGDDVFVIWDIDDAQSDIFLTAGLTLCRALCVRQQVASESQAANANDIVESIMEIERQVRNLGDIKTWTETIERNSGKILGRLRNSRGAIRREIESLNERLASLKLISAVKLTEESEDNGDLEEAPRQSIEAETKGRSEPIEAVSEPEADDAPSNQTIAHAERQFELIDESSQCQTAFELLSDGLESRSKSIEKTVSHDGKTERRRVHWQSQEQFWCFLHHYEFSGRFLLQFGRENPADTEPLTATCEMRIPDGGMSPGMNGVFLKDQDENVYLGFRGALLDDGEENGGQTFASWAERAGLDCVTAEEEGGIVVVACLGQDSVAKQLSEFLRVFDAFCQQRREAGE